MNPAHPVLVRRLRGALTAGAVGALMALAMTPGAVSAASGTSPAGIPAASNPNGKMLGAVPSTTSKAIKPAGQLINHGGPVQHSSLIRAIFWAPPGYYMPPSYIQGVNQYLADVAAASYTFSNVHAVTGQYYDSTAAKWSNYDVSYGGAVLINDAIASNGCPNYVLNSGLTTSNCIINSQIDAKIVAVANAHGWPTGLGSQYFLFTPPNLGSCFVANGLSLGQCYDPSGYNGYCAYHSSTNTNPTRLFANQPYANLSGCDAGQHPNGSAIDPLLSVVSHEQIETFTDPLGSAWYDTSGAEIGDKCAWNFGAQIGNNGWGQYNQLIGGHAYELQQEWSNRAGGCVLRNTYPQPTAGFVNSANPKHGTLTTFTSTAADSDGGPLSYAWRFGDGTGASVANPTRNYAAAGTYLVTLVVSDPAGDQVRVQHSIVVS